MTDNPLQDAYHRAMIQERRLAEAERQQRAVARGQSVGLLVAVLVAVSAASVILVGLDAKRGGPQRRQAEAEARDMIHLDCRRRGGAYEYFGSQGWHCVGAKQ